MFRHDEVAQADAGSGGSQHTLPRRGMGHQDAFDPVCSRL